MSKKPDPPPHLSLLPEELASLAPEQMPKVPQAPLRPSSPPPGPPKVSAPQPAGRGPTPPFNPRLAAPGGGGGGGGMKLALMVAVPVVGMMAFGLVVLIAVGAYMMVGKTAATSAPAADTNPITGIDQESRMRDAVARVTTGLTVVPATGGTPIEILNGHGTGFAVTPDGYVFTNEHVVRQVWAWLKTPAILDDIRTGKVRTVPTNSIFAHPRLVELLRAGQVGQLQASVWVFFGGEKYKAEVKHVSEKFDFALLKVERDGPYFRLRDTDRAPRGQKVYALGFPGVADDQTFSEKERKAMYIARAGATKVEEYFRPRDFEFVLTGGSVSRMADEADGKRWIQHDATIAHGNSGGPLVAEDGTALGMNTQVTFNERFGGTIAAGTYYALTLKQISKEVEKHVRYLSWN